MEGALNGLIIALLTIIANHLFQSRREHSQRIDVQKRESLENLVRSCQQILNDTTRFAQASRLGDLDEMSAIQAVSHEHGAAITRAKADALLVFDQSVREQAHKFIATSGHVRQLVSQSMGQDPMIDLAVQELNDAFGSVCDQSRALLFK